jgi:dethiobiotin synthetase
MTTIISSSNSNSNSNSNSTSTSAHTSYLYLVGTISGAGKSTVALGLLHSLLQNIPAQQIAYLKPATQCESVTLVSKFCVEMGIATLSTSPIVFYAGYTQQCIDKPNSSTERLNTILKAVKELAIDKKYFIIDGVGYPSVGHVCGISNAQIAAALRAPILLIGRAGVGDAIDSTEYMRGYLSYHHAPILGVLYNNIPILYGYHKYDDCVNYVTKYFASSNPTLPVYGFIPALASSKGEKAVTTATSMANSVEDPEEGQSCAVRSFLRRKKGEPIPMHEFGPEFKMTEEDEQRIQNFCDLFDKHVNMKQLLQDMEAFYGPHSLSGNSSAD